jgi:hypothetical protein
MHSLKATLWAEANGREVKIHEEERGERKKNHYLSSAKP